jgi:hypothetical protein
VVKPINPIYVFESELSNEMDLVLESNAAAAGNNDNNAPPQLTTAPMVIHDGTIGFRVIDVPFEQGTPIQQAFITFVVGTWMCASPYK